MPKLITSPIADDPRRALRNVYRAALEAVDGRRLVAQHLIALDRPEHVALVAVGKAAGAMAQGALDAWGEAIDPALVITKPGHPSPPGLEVVLGGHPVPDAASLEAGRRLLELLDDLPRACEVLFLVSGGTSSLVEVPVAGLGLESLAQANRWLLGSGLDIGRMNRVRKALSRIKAGGLLARLGDRRVGALAISDVPGDDLAVIGSGLLVPDPRLARAADLDLPPWLARAVRAGLAERSTISLPDPPPVRILAGLGHAKRAAAACGERMGYTSQAHTEFLEGDAAETGRRLVRKLTEAKPGLHVWGGETTVLLPPSPGRGGRNQHLALAAALEMRGREDLVLLAAGTDGTDGPTEEAGALVDGSTLERAAAEGLDGQDCLARADAGTLLEASGDLIRTGPTGTNVMDLVLGLRLT